MEASNQPVFSLALISIIIAPIISAFGLVLQHLRDLRRDKIEQKRLDAEAEKLAADTNKTNTEARILDSKADVDTINFYIGMVNTLRVEVNTLTELSRKNGGEIAILTAKLITSDEENKRLSKENIDLKLEVKKLREEVALLRECNNKEKK
jgi:cell division protein FtsB